MYFIEEKNRKDILHMSNKLFIQTLFSDKSIFELLKNDLYDLEGFIKSILLKIKASEKYGRNH